MITDEKNNHPAGCCLCGFKEIRPSDKYCQKCGATLCDEAKSVKSDLEKENSELRQQLAEVQKQLAEVWAELKKLTGKSDKKLEQQQINNKKAITDGSVAEMKEQVEKSRALVNELNSQVNTTSPVKNDNKSSSLPYVVGGSVLVGSILLIGGYLISKRKRGK